MGSLIRRQRHRPSRAQYSRFICELLRGRILAVQAAAASAEPSAELLLFVGIACLHKDLRKYRRTVRTADVGAAPDAQQIGGAMDGLLGNSSGPTLGSHSE